MASELIYIYIYLYIFQNPSYLSVLSFFQRDCHPKIRPMIATIVIVVVDVVTTIIVVSVVVILVEVLLLVNDDGQGPVMKAITTRITFSLESKKENQCL